MRKILIERDAFSSEEGMDTDPRTYWIPIGSETANDLGQFTSTIPSGKIRVSAFYGSVDETDARAQIESGAFDMLSDITREQVDGEDRTINPITAILGGVAGTTYLGSQVIMVDGEEGHSNGEATLAVDVSVPAVTSTGQVQWAGDPSFAGDPIKNATVVLTPADPLCFPPRLLNIDIIRVDRGRGPLLRRRGQCSVRWDRAVRLLEPSTGRGLHRNTEPNDKE